MLNNRKKRLFSLFSIVLLVLAFSSGIFDSGIFKDELRILENKNETLSLGFPFKVNDKIVDPKILKLESSEDNNSYTINPVDIGSTNLQLTFLGIIPFKDIKVNVVPKVELIPGGQSVGVRLNTQGVLIVGLEEFESTENRKSNPGEKAGLQIGDSILAINGIKVKDAEHVIELINETKDTNVHLTVKRDEKNFDANIVPVKSKLDGEYRMGLWVRDKTAGVGTLTFYDPSSMKFGALGHAITDIDTGLLLTIEDGEVVKSKVASIQPGKRGKPGEIKGIFYETTKPIGSLAKNTPYGIYGKAYSPIENSIYDQPLEIAYQDQIKEGKAQILTTLDDDILQAFDVTIEKVNRQRTPSTKSMVIRVTDKKLLQKSGGIVQGMSGSPIIQDNKIIGAVTHVFVNDPTKGYGLFIEWMLKEAEINLENQKKLGNND